MFGHGHLGHPQSLDYSICYPKKPVTFKRADKSSNRERKRVDQLNFHKSYKSLKLQLISDMLFISAEFIVEGVLMLGVASVGVVLNIIREAQWI